MDTLLQRIERLDLRLDPSKQNADLGIFIGNHNYKNERIIAKYIFTYCDAASFQKEMLSGDTILQQVVEDLFYELRDDLGWNLYLVCVMEPEEFAKISLDDRLRFQNNREFTRNLVLPLNRLEKEIPVGNVLLDDIDSSIENPFGVWNQSLTDSGLSFCLEDSSKKTIQSYIEGEKCETFEGEAKLSAEDRASSSDMPVINRIDSLNLTKAYRPHCFGAEKTLHFSRVNLLSGSNGAGKTSILQAIELVMTGEIRTENGNPSPEEALAQLYLIYNGGNILSTPADRSVMRTRESSWYMNRESTRTKPKLNDAFHVYNTFTAEDTFLFSFDGQQPEYDAFLSKILFGEGVKSAERNWKQCKALFDSELRALRAQLQGTKEQLLALHVSDPVSHETVMQYLNNMSIQYDPSDSMDKIKNLVIQLHTQCNSVVSLPHITTRQQLKSAQQELDAIITF